MIYLMIFAISLFAPVYSWAQEIVAPSVNNPSVPLEGGAPSQDVAVVPQPEISMDQIIENHLKITNPPLEFGALPSLFFTKWERDLIISARLGLNSGGSETIGSGIREISLEGIVFISSEEWTIWLNNSRVTPNAMPSEIFDINVYKDYIEIEWFDNSKNLIYPIKLKPKQRFSLDTRMFLPG